MDTSRRNNNRYRRSYSTEYDIHVYDKKIDAKVGIYPNAKYGDFKEVWDEIHKSKDCTTVD